MIQDAWRALCPGCSDEIYAIKGDYGALALTHTQTDIALLATKKDRKELTPYSGRPFCKYYRGAKLIPHFDMAMAIADAEGLEEHGFPLHPE